VSEEHQPTFEYGFATVNPGVPDGTTIAEISFFSSVGHRGDGDDLGDVRAGVRDEALGPVDHPLVAVEAGGGAGGSGVGPAAGLGQAEGTELLAGRELREPLRLLLVRAEAVDGHRAERHPRLQGDRDGRVDARELLQGEAEGEVVPAHAAELLADGQAEQAHRAHLAHELVRELLALVEVPDDRGDLLLREVLDGGPQGGVLLAEVEVHVSSPRVSR
jgi:hypothetical protein